MISIRTSTIFFFQNEKTYAIAKYYKQNKKKPHKQRQKQTNKKRQTKQKKQKKTLNQTKKKKNKPIEQKMLQALQSLDFHLRC